MPSLLTARRVANAKTNGATTIGQTHKENSDWAMEFTWDNDLQSKICYIYDYFHDDQPEKKDHMTYEHTTKTRIDAKFIVTQYGSITKDQVPYHIQFKPSQPVEFSDGDELYYFETDYRRKFDVQFPTSLYIDIPNEKGVYEKWLILTMEQGIQFIKYNVLPCNYRFEWVEVSGDKKFKRRMWGVDRQQLSYTAGTWIDRYFNSLDNVDKIYLPLNSITENINYVNDDNNNQRMIISAKTKHPISWKITKLENTKPMGILQLTLSQTPYNPSTDYIEKDLNGNIVGMWADFYASGVASIDQDTPSLPSASITAKITASTTSIKVGGSYKNLTVNLFNSNEDITSEYSDATFNWTCSIDDDDWTDKVTWRPGTANNQTKVKFPSDMSQLGKILNVKCVITNGAEIIKSESIQLELTN